MGGAALWFGLQPPEPMPEPRRSGAAALAPEPAPRLPRRDSLDIAPEPPPTTPTLERPEVQDAYSDHVAEVLPHWERVTAILGASTHPDLQRISRDLADRLVAAQAPTISDKTRQDLIHEERQLVNHLRQRYAGFEDLEGPLAALDEAVAALDGG